MKRRVIIIAAFLILGAVVNVAVAWLCAVSVRPDSQNPVIAIRTTSNVTLVVKKWARPGSMRLQIGWAQSDIGKWIQSSTESDPAELVPDWAGSSSRKIDDERTAGAIAESWIIHANGFPMMTLWYGQMLTEFSVNSRFGPAEHAWRMRLSPWSTSSSGRNIARVLPLHPIWPNFAINTLFYALLLWVIFCSPFVLQRWRRRRRGWCVRCGYDLRGTEHEKCPECGAEVGRRSDDQPGSSPLVRPGVGGKD